MRISKPKGNGSFAAGFVTAFALLVVGSAMLRAAQWASNHPQPAAIHEYLAAPRLSILNVVDLGLIVLLVWVILHTILWGLRVSNS